MPVQQHSINNDHASTNTPTTSHDDELIEQT